MLDRPTFVHLQTTNEVELSKSVSASASGGNNGLPDRINPGLGDGDGERDGKRDGDGDGERDGDGDGERDGDGKIEHSLVYDLSILKQCLKFEKQGKEFATATI